MTETRPRRKIPFPSEATINFMNVIYTLAYFVVKPLGLAPATMALISGGLFGSLLLPVSVLYALLYLLREYILPDAGFIHDGILYSVVAMAIWYLWNILTDDTHTRVNDTCFRTPRTVFDRFAYKFFLEIFHYFPMTCVPQNERVTLSPQQQYVVGVHPHGIHCFPLVLFGSAGTPFDEMFPGLVSGSKTEAIHPWTGLAATVMFKIPAVREFFLAFGYIDASRNVANAALMAGKSIFVVPGGEEESMYSGSILTRQRQSSSNCSSDGGRNPIKEDVLVLQRRKGFVRLALRHGAALVPVYGIGNDHTFATYPWFHRLRLWIQKKFQVALPIFHGRCFTPLPYAEPLTVVIGEPIQTPQPKERGALPSEALVNEYHQKYIAALKDIHSKHVKDRPLRIV